MLVFFGFFEIASVQIYSIFIATPIYPTLRRLSPSPPGSTRPVLQYLCLVFGVCVSVQVKKLEKKIHLRRQTRRREEKTREKERK